jgi:multidrug efflux system membrane fusion protein
MNRPAQPCGVSLVRVTTRMCLAAGLLLALASCSGDDTATRPPSTGRGEPGAPVPVTTAPVVEKPMAVNVRAVGNVEAASTVEVRSQVTGELLSVEFREGDDVAAGQRLFTIDPRPFDAALRRAEAALARDTALSKNAEAQRTRYADLLQKGLVSQAEYDMAVASAASLQAAISADVAEVENAKVQLQYTTITARVAGRTGALMAHQGALVRANDASPLVVINQTAPVFVSFAVPSRLLPEIRARESRAGLTVEAAPPGGAEAPSEGVVSFIDNAVDTASDTIRLKARFANTDRQLWPGTFVDVTLRLSVEPRAVVVPSTAVQPGQQGPFVYVVKEDQTVEARTVAPAWTEGRETVIERGLSPGEVVVTDGHLRLAPGARIVVKAAGDPPKGSS